jgi:cell division protein FtsQ
VTNNRYGAPRGKKKKNALYAPLAFVLVCLAVVFAAGVFFRVRTIKVVGTTSYTDEQVIDASGIELGDNLFFINRFKASSNIFSKLPFVESATIERSFPNSVTITISEGYAVAYVDWQGQEWMLTTTCKLLGTGTDHDLAGLIQITNITPESPSSGSIMTVGQEDSLKLAYLQVLLPPMQELGLVGNVSVLDMDNAADPTFCYLDRFTVQMGPNENTEYKLRMLLGAVEQMDSDTTGDIDLSGGTTVHVSPD